MVHSGAMPPDGAQYRRAKRTPGGFRKMTIPSRPQTQDTWCNRRSIGSPTSSTHLSFYAWHGGERTKISSPGSSGGPPSYSIEPTPSSSYSPPGVRYTLSPQLDGSPPRPYTASMRHRSLGGMQADVLRLQSTSPRAEFGGVENVRSPRCGSPTSIYRVNDEPGVGIFASERKVKINAAWFPSTVYHCSSGDPVIPPTLVAPPSRPLFYIKGASGIAARIASDDSDRGRISLYRGGTPNPYPEKYPFTIVNRQDGAGGVTGLDGKWRDEEDVLRFG